MSPPGARGPPGRGAPSHQGHRQPIMDRTSSLPNLRTGGQSAAAASEGRSQGGQIAPESPASPTSPESTGRSNDPSRVRPAIKPVPATRKSLEKTPESSYSMAPPSTHMMQKTSGSRTNVQPHRSTTAQPCSTNTSANNRNPTPAQQPSRADASRVITPSRTTTRTHPIDAPTRTQQMHATSATKAQKQPKSPNTVSHPLQVRHTLQACTTSEAHILQACPTLHATRAANRDPRSQTDKRRQVAPLAMPALSANTDSPAPPRTSAYDSPAMRSGQSSLSGSTISLASDGRKAEMEEGYTPISPTPSMELDIEFQAAARAQRRRRSSDEMAEEEAKRYCADSQRPHSLVHRNENSPTFADAVRRTPSPNSQAERANFRRTARAIQSPLLAPNATEAPNQATTATNSQEQAKKNKRPRYPPLIVEKLPNWATHFRALAVTLGRPPNARPYRQGVRFSPESEEEYRVVQRYLTTLEKEGGISWFAYSLAADRKLKVAIRGLPADTNPQDIEEELRSLGYEPEFVRHINARQGRPGCVFHAVLNKTENVRAIYDTTTFMLMRGVKIEAWRGKRGPAQCHRCQQFRHSSHQCHRPLACVKCGEGHMARDCPRPREEPATCANCKGPHPANNIKCPIYQHEIKNRRAGTVAITTASSRPPQKEVRTEAVNIDTEAQGTTLMAAANGPTQRGEPANIRRRKNKRGGKGRKTTPKTTQTSQEATSEAAPVVTKAQAANKQFKNITSAGATQPKRHSADEIGTINSTDQSAGARQTEAPNRIKGASKQVSVIRTKNSPPAPFSSSWTLLRP